MSLQHSFVFLRGECSSAPVAMPQPADPSPPESSALLALWTSASANRSSKTDAPSTSNTSSGAPAMLPAPAGLTCPFLNRTAIRAHERGIVSRVPGLFFVGLHCLYSMTSATVVGVGRDAKRAVNAIAAAITRRPRQLDRPGSSQTAPPVRTSAKATALVVKDSQFVWPCTACGYFGSLRVVLSCCKTEVNCFVAARVFVRSPDDYIRLRRAVNPQPTP